MLLIFELQNGSGSGNENRPPLHVHAYSRIPTALLVMLRLLKIHCHTICVPLLSYAIEVIQVVDKRQSSKMRVAYNSVFRRLFGYSYRESVSDLQHMLGRPTWEELVAKRNDNFVRRLVNLPTNSLVRAISSSVTTLAYNKISL